MICTFIHLINLKKNKDLLELKRIQINLFHLGSGNKGLAIIQIQGLADLNEKSRMGT